MDPERSVVPCLHDCELRIVATVDRARSRLVVECRTTESACRPGPGQAHEGLGLTNARARLRQWHGDAALLLGPRPGSSACARIELPLTIPAPDPPRR